MSIYFTQSIPRQAIWGGKKLREYFHFEPDFGDDVGQAWAFSAQEAAPSLVSGGGYTDVPLNRLWTERPELFRSRYESFPYIISLVAPMDDLSLQVHPDAAYARMKGYTMGKNEAWYFLDAPDAGSIVYGHQAQDEASLRQMIAQEAWDDVIRRLPVEQGETVYIPAGTLHALGKGSVVYEIQQATDVTYRFYDYNRRDASGQLRPLQLEDAIACLHYDCQDAPAKPLPEVRRLPGVTEITCLRCDSFVVRRLDCQGACMLHYPGYLLATVAEGEGYADGLPIRMGQSFLIPAGQSVEITGRLTLLTTAEQ